MRDRMLAGGGEAFGDHELLEYVLGVAIPRRDTKPLAHRLLKEFGDLPAVLAATPAELARVEGLGEGAAAMLKFVQVCANRSLRAAAHKRAVLSSFDTVIAYLHAEMAHGLTEAFRVLFLNARNMLIRDELMGRGPINAAPVYPREVVKRALELGATAMILVHNHPSGDPTPSRDDITMTKAIADAGRPLGLLVHDHLVIGSSGHASFRALGLL